MPLLAQRGREGREWEPDQRGRLPSWLGLPRWGMNCLQQAPSEGQHACAPQNWTWPTLVTPFAKTTLFLYPRSSLATKPQIKGPRLLKQPVAFA